MYVCVSIYSKLYLDRKVVGMVNKMVGAPCRRRHLGQLNEVDIYVLMSDDQWDQIGVTSDLLIEGRLTNQIYVQNKLFPS